MRRMAHRKEHTYTVAVELTFAGDFPPDVPAVASAFDRALDQVKSDSYRGGFASIDRAVTVAIGRGHFVGLSVAQTTALETPKTDHREAP